MWFGKNTLSYIDSIFSLTRIPCYPKVFKGDVPNYVKASLSLSAPFGISVSWRD